ncbi:MAG: bifunctional folylpolyglutamate synthase/dihydrofolate synthase [Bacteroidaceae bacterium]|nr:bifunctional folylpolyglutamate synthase/dihydrofolate synthase [Bacteroidaceae bacterium]
MTYREAEEYLYTATPFYQHKGKSAYKSGLATTVKLNQHYNYPHRRYLTVHVGGTNGKGSVAHTLAAILQAQGYRTGLYTSPHLLTFRERIRVNGEMIPEERVARFVEEERSFFEPLHPSFFELATALAFKYFEEEAVDIAIIEVGLGGRLDCTNVITPVVSIVTNVSFDHTDLLGDSLMKIAREKAGIFKPRVPAVVGEVTDDTADVFLSASRLLGAPLAYAQGSSELLHAELLPHAVRYETRSYGTFEGELTGAVQVDNARTVLTALRYIPLKISKTAVQQGFANVCRLTGLMGRWQRVAETPEVVCDTGHNAAGWQYLSARLATEALHRHVHIVFGLAADKDLEGVVSQLPISATYYFTQASVSRALPVGELTARAAELGINGTPYTDVPSACRAALATAAPGDLVFVGGSTFVVADFLESLG